MTVPHHRALDEVPLCVGGMDIFGFSISGLATYLRVPALDIMFDAGECPLSALSINHLALSHAHGDHHRCLLRHYWLRKMMGHSKEAAYYVPQELVLAYRKVVEAEAVLEGMPATLDINYPNFVGLKHGEATALQYRKNIDIRGFRVEHRDAIAMGFVLEERRQKLLPEFEGLSQAAIVEKKNKGTALTQEHRIPKFCFVGDHTGIAVCEQDAFWQAPVAVFECTYLAPEDEEHAHRKGHTHLSQLVERIVAQAESGRHVVLKHFSMKYGREEIYSCIKEAFPSRAMDFVHILLAQKP